MMKALPQALLLIAAAAAFATDARAKAYPSPDAAIDALVAAVRSGDPRSVAAVLGPRSGALVQSGDPVADKNDRAAFAKIFDAKHQIEVHGTAATLVVGDDARPFPIPLRAVGGRWMFDIAAARQDILDRRVGRNELNAIEVCRAIVDAERDYAGADRTGAGFAEYAQKFMSDAGQKNGLYWPSASGEPQSPLGPLVAEARAQGYNGRHAPYHGYFYKILLSQGSHAQGGAGSYVLHGHMIAGFAVLAYPAKWGDSGVMTFMVDRSGQVLQRNLGRNTARIAPSIARYDPDAGWKPAEAAPAK
jgi:hypothetical protein